MDNETTKNFIETIIDEDTNDTAHRQDHTG